ncbi:MAG: hypothetical protein ACI9S8_000340 [Chlamydiales bacterium]|jgi:hypothetical protein
MGATEVFTLKKGNIYALPTIHYNLEMAAQVRLAFTSIRPDCVAVELAETMQDEILHASSRLPDISVVVSEREGDDPLYYMCEPCDPAFEGVRSALEEQTPVYCIDLDVDDYPDIQERVPDPYAVHRIGLKPYYEAYHKSALSKEPFRTQQDINREMHMAKRLKELSEEYDSVLFIGGMFHIHHVLQLLDKEDFPDTKHCKRDSVQVCTLSEQSCRDVMRESGWFSKHYESLRDIHRSQEDNLLFIDSPADSPFPPDRQKLLYSLYSESGRLFEKNTGNKFLNYHLRNTMKFVRNYALIKERLMPDLFQTLSAAKACVEHNYAYEVWELATHYPHRKNIDNLPELDLSIEEVWGHSKIVRFHMKQESRKRFMQQRKHRKEKDSYKFKPPGPFTLCSYPPEDLSVEGFGDFLKKKGCNILSEEGSQTVPFTTSLEDGIDTRETIRNWHQKKLFVKSHGRPPGGTGSVVVIFDEDMPKEGEERSFQPKYPWLMTWLGEHEQESDMSFYSTGLGDNVVGPGISRCEYGGFMMSYPPRRMYDIWSDLDYSECINKSELLLMAAIDYAVKPIVVYVAAKPPRSIMKSFASRYGKKIVYIPIGQMSPVLLNKLRVFHVLDGHDKRNNAGDYIF